VRPEGLSQQKIPVTPSGIEHATLRLIVQCLNHNIIMEYTVKTRFATSTKYLGDYFTKQFE
jgi:hypothetical protein